MQQRQRKRLYLLATLLTLVSIFVLNTAQSFSSIEVLPAGCLQSFSAFAYENLRLILPQRVPPSTPWEAVTTVPLHPYTSYLPTYRNLQVVFTRSVGAHVEIWMTAILSSREGSMRLPIAIIYSPHTQAWEFISGEIGDTGFIIGNHSVMLYQNVDGSVWARTEWDEWHSSILMDSAPVLSKFNENTRTFALEFGSPEIPVIRDQPFFDYPAVVADNHGIFWVFTSQNLLIRYDPQTETTQEHTILSFPVIRSVLNSNGAIFIERDRWGGDTDFQLVDNTLFQFSPEFGSIEMIDTPEGWPLHLGTLLDKDGRLWLGSSGYRDTDGTWQLLHPNPSNFFAHAGNYMWSPPYLMMQSSDGRLWYRRYLDTEGHAEGTAWYDPETNNGCLITNYPAQVSEDSNHRLWLAAGDELYMLAVT